jgi:hypothetical protein
MGPNTALPMESQWVQTGHYLWRANGSKQGIIYGERIHSAIKYESPEFDSSQVISCNDPLAQSKIVSQQDRRGVWLDAMNQNLQAENLEGNFRTRIFLFTKKKLVLAFVNLTVTERREVIILGRYIMSLWSFLYSWIILLCFSLFHRVMKPSFVFGWTVAVGSQGNMLLLSGYQ